MGNKLLSFTLADIASIHNLLAAWQEFVRGKRLKPDVHAFSLRLMDHLFVLSQELTQGTYRHGPYRAFSISDPKPRNIHKASVRDRLVHHAIHRVLYPYFDKMFIADSFSCRVEKGTYKAMDRFRSFAYVVSKNYTRTCWVLKCDIKKFFASIDHTILLEILRSYITDSGIFWLIQEIIGSFSSIRTGIGLPLGNLTSQLFANVYMHEFDKYAKHIVRAKYYIRYADDFVFLLHDRAWLEGLIPQIESFLRERLRLSLHPNKVFIKTVASGVDFLGWVHFPDHRVLRTITKRRMFKRLAESPAKETRASYLGLLKHGNAKNLKAVI